MYISTKRLDTIIAEWLGSTSNVVLQCNSLMRRGLIDYVGDGDWRVLITKEELEMNSARIQDRLQRAWLKVTRKGEAAPGHSIMCGELFDGTPFEFTIPNHEYEDQGPDCPPLVEVGLVGNVGNVESSRILEVILPAPVLTLGHNVRVNDTSVIKWDAYRLIQEKNKAAK